MDQRALAMFAVLALTACTGTISGDDPSTTNPSDDASSSGNPTPPEGTNEPDPLLSSDDASVAVQELRRRDAATDVRVDAATDVRIDVAADVRVDAAADVRVDAAVDVRVDAAVDVPVDRPADVAVDVTPPPAACAAAAGGGSTTVRAPVQRPSLRDVGSESWLGAPAVVDLDRDGVMEVVAAREQRVVAWRANGTVRWGAQPGTSRVWAPPLIGDFTGDANLEVVVAAGDRIAMYTAAGAMAPGFPVRWRDEIRGLAAGDLDGDGRPEIVATTTNVLSAGGRRDVMTAFRGTGAVLRGFPPNTSGAGMCDGACDVSGGYDQNLAIGRIDDDALMDVVAPTDNAYVSWHRGTGEAFPAASIFRGVTRAPGVRWITDYALAQQGYADNEDTAEQAHFTNSAPAVADIDGDGRREIVVVGSIQNVSQADRYRGVGLFVFRSDGTRLPGWTSPYQVRPYLAGLDDLGDTNVVGTTNEVTVADVDPASPGLEMIFAGYDGRVWCVGANRSTRWSYQFTTANNQLPTGALVADLSGDGRPEVIFTTYSTAQNTSALFVLSSSGALLHRVALPGRGSMSTPAVGDIDRDGTLEIVVNLKDATAAGDEVLVYNVPGSSTNCTPWPVARRTALRDGYVR